MEISIDDLICQGHGVCYVVASSLFNSDQDGRGVVTHHTVPDTAEADARVAEHRCPEGAISLSG
jgi:ferredoxin